MSDNLDKSDQFDAKYRSLEALLDFVEQTNTIESLNDIIWHLAKHTIKALSFEECVIYLLDKDQESLIQVAAFGPKNPVQREILNPISLKIGEGIVGEAALQKTSLLIADTRLRENYVVDDQQRFSELAVPIIFHGKLLGVIDSENSEANFFTHQHVHYVEILASVLASKISFDRNIKSLEKNIVALESAQKLSKVFLKISELTYNSITIEDFYLHLHQIIAEQVHTHSFFVVLLDTQSKLYSCPYMQDEENGGIFDLNIDNDTFKNALVADVISSQIPLLVQKKELEEIQKKGLLIRQTPKAFSWLAVPFEINKNLHGAIALQSYNPKIAFNTHDKEFLTFIAQHIATAIEQKLKDQKLHHLALHDGSTGLANRSLFLDRVEHAFLRVQRQSSTALAVLFIDFDSFKLINDNYGHQAGDKVLQDAAKRIASQLRVSDTLARLGGDEYAILLEDIENVGYAITIAKRILEVMKPAVQFGDKSIFVTLSIGIALKDENTDSSEDLIKNADHAMYYAKDKGKNNIQVYEDSLHQAVIYATQVVKELEIAIKEKQLLFYFQPIVNLTTEKVVGFEALMRWQHPKRGLISPAEFIKIAEENDLIRAIDSLLLESVAIQLKHWNSISQDKIYVSINISSQRFIDSLLITEIEKLIQRFQLSADSIVVEITEHILMENIGKARLLFHQLRQLGVKISLDDFGTGYSSLGYLHQMPFDIIKIDRSFINHIDELNPEQPIINTIISLAKTLNLEVVAEGIETELQLKLLCSLDCQYGQGFYYSKPISPQVAEKLVIKRCLKKTMR